jgi:periplasmic divalent cation tolerance protein
MVIVLCNTPPDKARDIAIAVVDAGLAACVNIIPGVQSVFTWGGKRCEEAESTLLIKAPDANLEALRSKLLAIHPYDVPEFVVLGVDAARSHPAYVAWVDSFDRRAP